MAARFKSTIGLIILIVIGIIGIFYFLVPSAEEDIHMLAERVLQETIIEDYHVRSNAKSIYSRPGGRKIKNYQIETEKGIETFSFKGEFYQFNLSSCIRQQNSLTAQFVSFSLSNLANIFYPPPIFTIINLCLL